MGKARLWRCCVNKRPEIRNRIANVLKQQIPDLKGLFVARKTPVWENDEFPCVNVASGEESAQGRMPGGHQTGWHRKLDIFVEVAVRGSDDPATELDELCGQVERSVTSDLRLGGMAEDIEYISTVTAVTEDGKGTFGTAELKFEVTYIG